MKNFVWVVCVGLMAGTGLAQEDGSTKTDALKALTVQSALERQIAKSVVEQNQATEPENHAVPAQNPAIERPSYYVNDTVYLTCKDVQPCDTWAREQVQQEVHFQVLSASLTAKEDLHHSRLTVKYIKFGEEQEKVFEEDFDGWKEK